MPTNKKQILRDLIALVQGQEVCISALRKEVRSLKKKKEEMQRADDTRSVEMLFE